MMPWLTSAGRKTKIEEMDTCHLFYTLRLVWNTLMPRPLSVGTYKAVYFQPDLYTPEYWTSVLPDMYSELQSRSDLPARYKKQLANMQMPHLMERVCSMEALANALNDFNNREENDYEPEERTWDDEPG